MVQELAASGMQPVHWIGHAQWWTQNSDFQPASGTCWSADTRQLQAISALKNAPDVLAVARMPDKKPLPEKNDWMLALDGIGDPGNAGTLLRLADWFGIQDVLATEDTVDVFNPKVVQASMGAVFRVCVHSMPFNQWPGTFPLWGAVLEGPPLDAARFTPQGILVIGSESHGIREPIGKGLHHQVHIPRWGGGESLNAAVSAGIILHSLRAQVPGR